MGFLEDETGIESSLPRELYVLVAGSTTYRRTSHSADVVYDGNTYTAAAIHRSNVTITSGDQPEMIVELPVSDSFVQDNAFGFPPQAMTLTIYRLQTTSGVAIVLWQSVITSVPVEGRVAKVRSPSKLDDPVISQIPSAYCQRMCNHSLYDDMCGKIRADFDLVTSVSAQSGNTLTVASVSGAVDQYYKSGDILVGNERRLILDQTGAVLTLIAPFTGVSNGTACTIYAGCDHSVETCRDKFSNVANYGGFPFLHWKNPYLTRYSRGGQ